MGWDGFAIFHLFRLHHQEKEEVWARAEQQEKCVESLHKGI